MADYYIAGIIREEDGSGYSVYFPDLPSVCAGGASVQEAIRNATEGLHLALIGMEDDGQEVPGASDLATVREKVKAERALDKLPWPEDAIFQYIPAPDLDMAPVRVNLTIPKRILTEIDRNAELAGMTRSGFLVAAAKAWPIQA